MPLPVNVRLTKLSLPGYSREVTNRARVERLLAQGANIEATEEEGTTPLHVAAILGRAEMVRFLIGKGAAINATNTRGATTLFLARTAYTLAKRAGHEQQASERSELIKWLREHGAVDTAGTEPRKNWWQFWR